jgi:DNA-binding winged helix-turn-helix (wHTH) protein
VLSGLSNDVMTFGDFSLDPAERRLTRGGEVVDLHGRYLDALILLASHPGELVTKDRFMAEVWSGVPVTDEALTQCIRSLRRALGDDAANPRLIATVPRHGYRFIAEVTRARMALPTQERRGSGTKESPLLLTAAGLAGGAAAGLVGGLGYGLMAANAPPAGTGAISVLLVLTCLCLLVGLLGGLGVGAGIAAGRQLPGGRLFPLMLGGGIGGLAIGAVGQLVGLDAFALLVGSRPAAITGASEGLPIGALAGAASWYALRPGVSVERAGLTGAGLGAVAGLLVTAAGGQMMAGSLAALALAHPQAPLGSLLGSPILSRWVELASSAIEGAIFVGALSLAFALVARHAPRTG